MYGILVASGILISLLVGEKLIKDGGFDTNTYWSSSLWAIVGGVVGARLYHVIDLWKYYSANPIDIILIHHGGLAIYGALIGGTISLFIYFSVVKSDILEYLDVAAIVIPLGQAMGRWGNFVNMEILGTPTDLPWGMFVPAKYRPQHLIYNDIFHPIFLYESLLDILLFFVLLLLYRRKIMLHKKTDAKKPLYSLKGFFTLSYMVGYGMIRFSLEFLRLETWMVNNINIAQLISMLFIFSGIFGLFYLNRQSKA